MLKFIILAVAMTEMVPKEGFTYVATMREMIRK